MNTKANIGAEIQKARESMGLSQRALGKAAKVSGELIRQYELGMSLPVVDKLARISAVLQVTEFNVDGHKVLVNPTPEQESAASAEQLALKFDTEYQLPATVKIRASRVEIAIDTRVRRL